MKLVKIDDCLYVDPKMIRVVKDKRCGAVLIRTTDGDFFSNEPIEKVIEAINDNENNLVSDRKKYNISINRGDTGSNFFGTIQDIISMSYDLQGTETLTIRAKK